MTLDEVRELLLRTALPYAVYRNTTGVKRWCAAHGVNDTHVSTFLQGRRLPPNDMLDALGLEWTIRRKPQRGRRP